MTNDAPNRPPADSFTNDAPNRPPADAATAQPNDASNRPPADAATAQPNDNSNRPTADFKSTSGMDKDEFKSTSGMDDEKKEIVDRAPDHDGSTLLGDGDAGGVDSHGVYDTEMLRLDAHEKHPGEHHGPHDGDDGGDGIVDAADYVV